MRHCYESRDEEYAEAREDERVWELYQEHMHALEAEEAEKDRQKDEAFLEEECPTCFGRGGCADCMNEDDIRFDDCGVPA